MFSCQKRSCKSEFFWEFVFSVTCAFPAVSTEVTRPAIKGRNENIFHQLDSPPQVANMSLLFNSYTKIDQRACSSQKIMAKVILTKNPKLDPSRASMLLNLGFNTSLARLKGSKWRKSSAKVLKEEVSKEEVSMSKGRPVPRQDWEVPRYRKKSAYSSRSGKSAKNVKKIMVKKIGRRFHRKESLTEAFLLKIGNARPRIPPTPTKQPWARGKH